MKPVIGVTYVLVGTRTGSGGRAWLPNQLVQVSDAFSQIDGDRLIAGVTYVDGEDGLRILLRVVGIDAFDLSGDAENGGGAGRRQARHTHAVDATAGRYR